VRVGADTAVVFPVPNLTGGFSGQAKATRTERISFNESLAALHRDPSLRCEGRDTERYGRLGGRLGIADLFERAGRTRKVANLTGLTRLDYNLDFIIKSNAGLEPRFIVVALGNDKSLGGGLKLAGSNSDTQTLKLTLVPPAQGPPRTGLRPAPAVRDRRSPPGRGSLGAQQEPQPAGKHRRQAAPPEPWQLRRATATVSIPGVRAPPPALPLVVPLACAWGADVATKAPVASPVALR